MLLNFVTGPHNLEFTRNKLGTASNLLADGGRSDDLGTNKVLWYKRTRTLHELS